MLRILDVVFWSVMYGSASYLIYDAIVDPQDCGGLKLAISLFLLLMVGVCHWDHARHSKK